MQDTHVTHTLDKGLATILAALAMAGREDLSVAVRIGHSHYDGDIRRGSCTYVASDETYPRGRVHGTLDFTLGRDGRPTIHRQVDGLDAMQAWRDHEATTDRIRTSHRLVQFGRFPIAAVTANTR
jgi:hypothetical protein